MAEEKKWVDPYPKDIEKLDKTDPYHLLKFTLKRASAASQKKDADGNPKYTKDEINQFIVDQGFKSVKDFERAVINYSSIQLNKYEPSEYLDNLKGNVRETVNGISMGFWDKVEALASAVVDDTPDREGEGFLEDYEYHKQRIMDERKEYQEFAPIVSTISNLAGAGLTGGALSKAVIAKFPSLAATAGAPWWNAGKEGVVEGIIGAVEGGVTAMNTEGADVAEGAGWGALLGTTLGTGVSRIIDPLANYAKQGYTRVKEKVADAFDDWLVKSDLPVASPVIKMQKEPSLPEKRAMDRREEAFNEEGMTPEMRQAELDRQDKAGLGDSITPSSIGGESTAQLRKDAAASPGPARQEVIQDAQMELKSDRAKTQEGLKKGLGFSEEGKIQHQKDLFEQMQADADPMYKEAYASEPITSKTENVDVDFINETMSKKRFREAYKEASEINDNAIPSEKVNMAPYEALYDKKGNLLPGASWTIESLDMVKQTLDEMIRLPPSATGAIKKKNARALRGRLNKLLTEVDKHSPAYGQARQTWSGTAAEKDAYEAGIKAYEVNTDHEEVYEAWSKLKTPAERDAFRLAASTHAVSKMDKATAPTKGHSKIMTSPDAIKKHNILFSNFDEAQKFTSKMEGLQEVHQKAGEVKAKSPTGPLMISRFINGAMDLVSSGSGIGKVVKAGQIIQDPLKMVQVKQTNEALSKQMTQPKGAEATQADLDAMSKRRDELEGNLVRRQRIGAGVAGATGSGTGQIVSDENELIQAQKERMGFGGNLNSIQKQNMSRGLLN